MPGGPLVAGAGLDQQENLRVGALNEREEGAARVGGLIAIDRLGEQAERAA